MIVIENKLSRKQQGLKTKERIFNTAVKLIEEKGYKNITVNEICEEAEVSKGGFYVHYKSKEDIIRESYYINMGEFVERHFKEYIERNKESDTIEKIKKFLYLELLFARSIGYEVTCLAYTMNLNECVPGPSNHLEKRKFTEVLKELLKGREWGIDREEAFLFLESGIRGFMASWCFSNNSFKIEEKGERFIEILIKGIL